MSKASDRLAKLQQKLASLATPVEIELKEFVVAPGAQRRYVMSRVQPPTPVAEQPAGQPAEAPQAPPRRNRKGQS